MPSCLRAIVARCPSCEDVPQFVGCQLRQPPWPARPEPQPRRRVAARSQVARPAASRSSTCRDRSSGGARSPTDADVQSTVRVVIPLNSYNALYHAARLVLYRVLPACPATNVKCLRASPPGIRLTPATPSSPRMPRVSPPPTRRRYFSATLTRRSSTPAFNAVAAYITSRSIASRRDGSRRAAPGPLHPLHHHIRLDATAALNARNGRTSLDTTLPAASPTSSSPICSDAYLTSPERSR